MHLRYCLDSTGDEIRHSRIVMKELGISYQHATLQSFGPQVIFWNCECLPAELPTFITKFDIDPMIAVGHGLTHEQAIEIACRALELSNNA